MKEWIIRLILPLFRPTASWSIWPTMWLIRRLSFKTFTITSGLMCIHELSSSNLRSTMRISTCSIKSSWKCFVVFKIVFRIFSWKHFQKRLIMEFPPTGGILTDFRVRTSKLIRYFQEFDFVVLAFECVFVLFILYYTSMEIVDVRFSFVFSFFSIDKFHY